MNISRKTSQLLLCLTLGLAAQSGFSADIDIYARPSNTLTDFNLNPNILVLLDNSANWASADQHWPDNIKQGEAELNALRIVAGELTSATNLGLMMFTDGGGSANPGAYVRFRIRQMTPTNKAAFSELIGYPSGCVDGPNSLNDTPNCILKNFNGSEKIATAMTNYSTAMLDVFKYFGGYTWPDHAQDNVAGTPKNSSQFGNERYAGKPDPKSDPYAFMLLDGTPAYDSYIDTKGTDVTTDDVVVPKKKSDDPNLTKYVTPLHSLNSCAKNYLIVIGNGFPTSDSTDASLLGPTSLLPAASVGGDLTQLPLANLATTTTTQYKLLAKTACGQYKGSPDSIPASTAACQSKATDGTFASLYPGYDSYTCAWNSTCSAGSTSTSTTLIGTSSCALYTSQADCETKIATAYPGYSSYSCTAQTACTSSSANPTNPIKASTACISDNLNTAANCTAYGALNFPGYSGFSCLSLGGTACTGGDKQWRIDAATKLTSGYTYSMNGITSTTVTGESYSQNITGTYTTTAAAPDGTYSSPTNANTRYFDEWTRYLHRTDVSEASGQQNVTTFTIDVFKDKQDFDQTSLLLSAAAAGGGKYFKASDQESITNALRKIFSEIQAVNSVFASSSLPVSVNTQGTYLNQVFMGMFRPEGSAAPRWPGNLKQYKFAVINGRLQLSDKNGDAAISSTTGFVTPCADSFWSTDTGRYWDFSTALALGDCSAQTSAYPAAGSTSIYSDAPDGEVVEKGGAAQRLRGVKLVAGSVTTSTNYNDCGVDTPATASCRKLLTCDGSSATSCTSLTNFDISNTAVTAALPTDLIWWVRGKDVDNENGNTTTATATTPSVAITDEVRPSVHGGVIHSQPGVVDYGGTIGTIAFYGADDGVLHAVDGGQLDTEGIELWGFIAPELYGKLNRLRNNSPLVAFPSIPSNTSPAPTVKDYFFDGSIGIFQRSSTVWLYSSMRRGGRAVYAFDVSDPYKPKIKWRRGCFTDDTTVTGATLCSTGWEQIGQTWSHPILAFINGFTSGGLPKPVLIFGGGYDTCEDDHKLNATDANGIKQTPNCTTHRGNNIWFVDADTGKVLRTYPTYYSVPGDLAVLKDNAGYLINVYAADTGGNVYRINVGSTDTLGDTFSYWSPNTLGSDIRIANLSETDHPRKFLSGVAVARSAGFNAVLIGSGDREHPLVNSYSCNDYSTTAGSYVRNQFYMLMDKPLPYPDPIMTPSSLVDVTSGVTTATTDASVTTITNVTGGVTKKSTNGWRFNLGSCEQTVNEGIVIAGVTYFGTNTPSRSGSSCMANLGTARGYAVDYLTGNAVGMNRSAEYVGGGMPPSPVAGVVDVNGKKYPFCIGCIDTNSANPSALQGTEVIINPTGSRYRSYWYLENE